MIGKSEKEAYQELIDAQVSPGEAEKIANSIKASLVLDLQI